MSVPTWVWIATVVGIVGMLLFDFVFHVRKAHVPTLKEASVWSALYVGIAIVFGLGVLVFGGGTMGGEYFAGYITEKALSVDNLFVFLIIMGSFRVPREDQQKVLLSRWLETGPRVLILDEPTRGVDSGAKSEMYRIIDDLARRGIGVIVISSELPEIIGTCDRVLVMREGRLVGEVGGAGGAPITQENIMAYGAGAAAAA